jgi:hypothetical protein
MIFLQSIPKRPNTGAHLWILCEEPLPAPGPAFFKKNGEEDLPPATVLDALLKVTEAVCCVGCKHSHLLEMGAQPCYLKQSFAEVGV